MYNLQKSVSRWESLGRQRARRKSSLVLLGSTIMAINNGLRITASKLLSSSESLLTSKSVTRGFHSTGMKRMGGGHGHGHSHDEPYYIHAPHMYNLDRMKHQALKMSLGVFTAFSIGVAVPIYAVIFQQKNTASA
ncbi:hypothetical protein RJ641_031513 [Dillenia turbinata]|uniref:SLL1 protein n=1 Tax=Dillenia turbinata TaxID=194707 RepID=A0AAN8VPQ8_9MAGN